MAYQDFYVTQGAGASDLNGGGAALGTNDAAVVTRTNCTLVVEGAENFSITDDDAGGWGSAAVGDAVCWDTAGTKEFGIIVTLSYEGDSNVIEVFSASGMTAAAAKECRVGGAWATIDHAASTVSNSTTKTGSDAATDVYVNIKYEAASYDETVVFDAGGAFTCRVVYSGYESTARDDCPNGNYPEIDGSGIAATGIFYGGAVHYITMENMYIHGSQAGVEQIYIGGGDYWILRHLKLKQEASGSNYCIGSQYSSYGTIYYDVYCEDGGIITGYSARLYGCCTVDAPAYGYYIDALSTLVDCICDSAASHGFYIYGYAACCYGCVCYNAGVDGFYANSNSGYFQHCVNCISTDNGANGFHCLTTDRAYFCEYCATYNNTTAGFSSRIHNQNDTNIALTATPFMDAANGDFRLNNDPAGGALCRGAGYPGSIIGLDSPLGHDIGLQHVAYEIPRSRVVAGV